MRITAWVAVTLMWSTTVFAGPFDPPEEGGADIEVCEACPINLEVFLSGLDGDGLRFATRVAEIAKERSGGLNLQFYTLQLLPRGIRPGETMPVWPQGVRVILDKDGVQARRRGVSQVPAVYVDHNGQQRVYAGTAAIGVLRQLVEAESPQ